MIKITTFSCPAHYSRKQPHLMWKIALHILLIVGLVLSLFMVRKILSVTHQEIYEQPDLHPFGQGNAPREVQMEIMEQLELFQQGYAARDTSGLASFMDRLISRQQILILGTMPNEIYSGFEEAADLVQSDWLSWGDVKLLVEQSNISGSDSVVWVSTIGTVEFDLSRLLVLPLRFSGVMVREGQDWKFQQLQFQFDLDSSWILGAIFLLSLLLLATIIRFVFVVVSNR